MLFTFSISGIYFRKHTRWCPSNRECNWGEVRCPSLDTESGGKLCSKYARSISSPVPQPRSPPHHHSVLASTKTVLPREDGSHLLHLHSLIQSNTDRHLSTLGTLLDPRETAWPPSGHHLNWSLRIYLLIYPLHFSHPIILFCLFLFLP